MNLSDLPSITKRRKKRLGRGHGSGKVKTSGRGTKGQKARDSVTLGFEGGQLPIIKRLPFLRGKGKLKSYQKLVFPLPVSKINALPQAARVTVASLAEYHVIGSDIERVKLLGTGTIAHPYQVSVACSKTAASAIEKAGGKVVMSKIGR